MVVRRHPASGAPVSDTLTWGLIPHAAETRPDIQPMNARAETIREKPMFRDAYRRRRAVVPAKGKLHTIQRVDGEPLAVPAIWENRKDPETGRWECTFATLTMPANAAVATVHGRCRWCWKKDPERWLGPKEDPHDLLTPRADDILQIVSTGKPLAKVGDGLDPRCR
jgi:putative SOS response-associated peptidase YedK